MPLPKNHTGPVVECWHGTSASLVMETGYIVVPDSHEARDLNWWRTQVPPGALFRVTWRSKVDAGAEVKAIGEGRGVRMLALPDLPPVAGSLPDRVQVQLPNGARRECSLLPRLDGTTAIYTLDRRSCDARSAREWEALAPRNPPVAMKAERKRREIEARDNAAPPPGDTVHGDRQGSRAAGVVSLREAM